MFCTKCGAELAENVRFCVKCGQPVNAQPAFEHNVSAQETAPRQETTQQQAWQQAALKAQEAAGAMKTNVENYVKSSNKYALVGMGTFALCVILLFASAISALNVDIWKIHVFSALIPSSVEYRFPTRNIRDVSAPFPRNSYS